ncbi:MAG: CRTAC1 family protein [Planctomycetota bacterium]|nr:CRTAC1 family protein [Planctomycetota bacterium]
MSEWSPPPHRSVPWTLCASLAALSSCGGAEESAGNGPTPQPWWRAGEGAAALVFEPQSALSGRWLLPEIMGGGVAILDADGDGRLDVLLVNPRGDHGLFLGRDGGFADASAPAGLDQSLEGTAMGVACGDVDNDGDVDLYLTRHGPDRLLRNRGDGTFEDATEAFGVAVGGWSASAAFADYDGDGFLDLFVTQYVAFDAERECRGWSGRRDFCGPKEFPPLADVLLHNEGGAGFRDVSVEAGISGVACAGLGVVWEDVDRDGLVDLYVANDAYPNQCWRNEGDGSFRDVVHELGIALNLDGRPEAGMGIAAEDFCGDGRTDLFVTHLRAETNTLYRRRPNGEVFGDATGPSRLGGRSMPFTGFGVCALDVELDGDLDLFVANGRVNWAEPATGAIPGEPWRGFAEENLSYLNDGAGRFAPEPGHAAAFTAPVEVSRGLARGDLDADGDVDLVLANLAGAPRVLYNEAPRAGEWLSVRCRDGDLGRDALGARVAVVLADGTRRERTLRRGGSYLSSSEAAVHFGLGGADAVAGVEVVWPGGEVERFPGGPGDRALVLTRGGGSDR